MIVQLLGAFCVSAVFIGGGAFALGAEGVGFATAAMGAIGLGLLMATLQHMGGAVYGFTVESGITLGQLRKATGSLPDATQLYVADGLIKAAGVMFACKYGGGDAFVIEAKQMDEAAAEMVGEDWP